MPRTKSKKSDPVPPSPLVPASSGAQFSPVSLSLTDELDVDAWRALGSSLASLGRGINWWLGDWLNHGERKYGQTYAAASEVTGLDPETLSNIAAVASRIELPFRHGNLSWTHHQLVAYLDPPERDRLLAEAERERWSTRDMREAVGRLKLEIGAPSARRSLDVPELNRKIAAQASTARALTGMSQRDWAETVFGSRSQQGAVSQVENAKRRPNILTIERMAETAGLPVSSFGLLDAPVLPAAAVQRAAQEAIDALDGGDVARARAVLERLATALVEEDLPVEAA